MAHRSQPREPDHSDELLLRIAQQRVHRFFTAEAQRRKDAKETGKTFTFHTARS